MSTETALLFCFFFSLYCTDETNSELFALIERQSIVYVIVFFLLELFEVDGSATKKQAKEGTNCVNLTVFRIVEHLNPLQLLRESFSRTGHHKHK